MISTHCMLSRLLLLTLTVAVTVTATAADSAAVEKGRGVFEHLCAPCHGAGPGANGVAALPGTYALQLKYHGTKPALLEQRSDLPAAAIKTFVRHGVASMPPFRKSEVTDQDIEAIAAYLAQMAKRPMQAAK